MYGVTKLSFGVRYQIQAHTIFDYNYLETISVEHLIFDTNTVSDPIQRHLFQAAHVVVKATNNQAYLQSLPNGTSLCFV